MHCFEIKKMQNFLGRGLDANVPINVGGRGRGSSTVTVKLAVEVATSQGNRMMTACYF